MKTLNRKTKTLKKPAFEAPSAQLCFLQQRAGTRPFAKGGTTASIWGGSELLYPRVQVPEYCSMYFGPHVVAI